MSFLQPWMLYVLPAMLLPLIIHLLNRLRYKTVHWAAMMFLFKANKAATRRAKIKQYILLAIRMLLIGFLIWAMSRPLVGGWIGSAAGGAPDAVIILLDRSASMESSNPDRPTSKRAHALSLLEQAAKQTEAKQYVLIESVRREPMDVGKAENLTTMRDCGPTEASADIPAMFRAALDYLAKNNPGSLEIWVASDFHEDNWRIKSPEWQDIQGRLSGLPQDSRVRILDLSGGITNNSSVLLKSADLRAKADKGQLALTIEVSTLSQSGTIPAFVTRDGTKSQLDLPVASAIQRHNLKFDLPKSESSGGWGVVELPTDDISSDNSAYFVYAPPRPLSTSVISDGPSGLALKFAAAPDKSSTTRKAEILPASRADAIPWKDTALVIWQAGAPTPAVAAKLEEFVNSGGVLLCLPPGTDGAAAPLGVSWSNAQMAPATGPFNVSSWDELDGPLAKTDNGSSLAVGRIQCQRRQIPVLAGGAPRVYANFADGVFLTGARMGSGQVLACATLPTQDWSNLGEGLVLLPMVQRLLAVGGLRLAPPVVGVVGEWKPADEQETWSPLDPASGRDWRSNAGIYQSGLRQVALNRPEAEDDPDTTTQEDITKALQGVKVSFLSGAIDVKADRLQTEIWTAFIILAMVAMCAEMLLAASKGLLPAKPALRARTAGADSSPKTVEAVSV